MICSGVKKSIRVIGFDILYNNNNNKKKKSKFGVSSDHNTHT